ncbi:hypothetical protein CCHL11_04148 [Colletotrichum chlorophyti]|uniref:Heparan-alpha-glucosaminide N-acetyltransferase catalytic domain-containing protein n=1 Tax=Colletotrichum chlorophyti TaxID=708187 RepID=A0A1Q8RPK8_9PEZI|nr:hypothetical protein CCHL11_04148 [Colletotrichum chlorophyti]
MVATTASSSSSRRNTLRDTDVENRLPEDVSSETTLPNDEESVTAAESDGTPEQSASSNGYKYGSSISVPNPINGLPADGTAEPSTNTPPPTRALAPDLLRGLLMAVMAMDHNVIGLQSWPHSTGTNNMESDSAPIENWNRPMGYAVRTLSHLCAPGFTFLLGMGVVFFGRSRAKLGWSPAQMARHFAIRGAVLTLVSMVMGFVLTMGQLWFMNIVLVMLGVDYVLVGLLWLGVASTEPLLAATLDRVLPNDSGERAPLLVHTGHPKSKSSARAQTMSWHIHNTLLLIMAFVTIWWNIWLSPTHGVCTASPVASSINNFWRFWFFEVQRPGAISAFPPLAWISFAILGLLYARIVLARPRSPSVLVCGNAAAGIIFSGLFVLTRVLRAGNLSEGCLHTPDQTAHPDANPYLTSLASFFYVVKYPPDVAFFAYTLAVTFLLLAIFGTIPPRFATKWLGVLLAFGTSALFFYVSHLVILFNVSKITVRLFGHDTGVTPPLDEGSTLGVDNLWLWWANWAVVMAIMYPLCKWYSAFKKTKSADSVWRFF